jgi:sulfate transport system substrate-binding protein
MFSNSMDKVERSGDRMTKIRFTLIMVAVGGLLAVLASALTSRPASASRKDVTLNLVAYSTPREAYKKVIPAFQATPAGKGVNFTQSYGPSGDQSRAVLNGLPADVVEFSLAPDVSDLVKGGLVSKGWNRGPTRGMVTDSVVVFVVRDGNPEHIKTWTDLAKPGVQVLTPNPFTSGGARWNVMAAYGSQRKDGKTDAVARDYVLRLFKNVAVQDKSARDALQTYLSGKGDVLLTYENEAILAQKQGQPVQYVIPRNTILIENPVAIVNSTKNIAAAKAFVTFLRGAQAQELFAQTGYRPVLKSIAAKFKFPVRPGLFTIDSKFIGGWDSVQAKWFDPQKGIMADIERKVGGG